MDEGSTWPWIIAIVLLFLAAFFAAAETAIASCSRSKLSAADDRGDANAKEALSILDRFDLAVTTLLICTNIVHISIASLVTVAVTRRWGLSAVSVGTILTTIAVFFAGEMLPKTIAKKYAERLALSFAPVLCFLMRVFGPLARLLTKFGNAFSKGEDADAEPSVTENELYDIIEDMTEDGKLDEAQGELISSALQFGDVTVESILTPRVDLTALNVDMPASEIVSVVKTVTHSRLPVYEDDIDHIVGVLQIRKFMRAWLQEGERLNVRELLDEPFFTHQSAKIDELLSLMSKKRQNLAIVTDNYGGTLGIVTIEDILEELVGEIWDEDDVIEEPIVALGDGRFTVDADESVDDVFEKLGFEDPEENEDLVNTLMGEWAYEQLTEFPKPGDTFAYHGVTVTVSEMDHNRILSLTVTAPEGGENA